MGQLWVGTGWKMNHLIDESLAYAARLREYVETEKPTTNIFICVPFTVLKFVADLLRGSPIIVSSQNVHWADRGAFTGEISPLMVKDTGATMVEVGHSERREFYGENDVAINKKLKAALKHHLKPILCIGETKTEKQFNIGIETLNKQLKIALDGLTPDQICQMLIAYEPVWAIGNSGTPASPDYLNEIHAQISKTLCDLAGCEKGSKIPILYGGSVNPDNAKSLIVLPEVDGLFIGRSAWHVEGFINIIRIVESQKQ